MSNNILIQRNIEPGFNISQGSMKILYDTGNEVFTTKKNISKFTCTSTFNSCLENLHSTKWVAPAKHSILDSVHKCIKYTARGSGSSDSDPFFWLSPTLSRFSLRDSSLFFGFSNILAVFSLYNTCNVTETKRKRTIQLGLRISYHKLLDINIKYTCI